MNRPAPQFQALLVLALPALLTMPACEGGPTNVANPETVPAFAAVAKLPSAIGAGQMYVGGELRTLVIDAKANADGTADGFWLIHNRAKDFVQKYDVRCLTVMDNVAYVGGVWSDDPSRHAIFKVVDNGPGGRGTPDQDSQTFSSVPGQDYLTEFCANPVSWLGSSYLYDVTGGDIRVQGG